MTTPLAHEARITALEYAVFEQFPHTLEAMLHPLTRANGIAEENIRAIAGLRVDMAALQMSVHSDVVNLKAALDLQNDSLHNQLADATAEYRASVTGVREEISVRFEKVDGRFNGVNAEIAALRDDVTTVKGDVTTIKGDLAAFKGEVSEQFAGVNEKFAGVNERFNGLDAKLDTLIAEIRAGHD